MKAQELIRQSELPPNLLTIVERAYEMAWLEVSPQLSKNIAPERARIRLVSIILLLSRIIRDDPERLKTAALKAFDRHDYLELDRCGSVSNPSDQPPEISTAAAIGDHLTDLS